MTKQFINDQVLISRKGPKMSSMRKEEKKSISVKKLFKRLNSFYGRNTHNILNCFFKIFALILARAKSTTTYC